MTGEPNPALSTPPEPGFVETFTNREARWRAAGGSWETGPNGVHVLASRVAAWYVCRAVRPPDYALLDVSFTSRDDAAGDTAAAAVSILTDQGHRALSAAVDVKNRRLLLFGLGAELIAQAPLPAAFDPDASHRLVLHRDGPTVRAEMEGVVVQGPLKRSINDGLIAFWIDPGVEATYHRLAIYRGFQESAPWDTLPRDWVNEPGNEGIWLTDARGLRFKGRAGMLRKEAAGWDDVQISVSLERPEGEARAGFALAGADGSALTVTVGESNVLFTWAGEAGVEEVSYAVPSGPAAKLTLRRTGRTGHLAFNDKYLGAHDVPTGPSEFFLTADHDAAFQSVEVREWL